jgi:hypothetical protein
MVRERSLADRSMLAAGGVQFVGSSRFRAIS